jgi:hypothetical protein
MTENSLNIFLHLYLIGLRVRMLIWKLKEGGLAIIWLLISILGGGACLDLFYAGFGEAEICELYPAICINQDVVWLQVPVNDSFRMQVVQG